MSSTQSRNYFKRLDHIKQDVPTKPFNGLKIEGLDDYCNLMPIAEFMEKADPENLEKIFNFSKKDREKNCGLGDNYINEVKEKRNAGFYLKVEKAENEQHTTSLLINFNLDKTNNVLYDQSFIHIAAGANVKIFIYYSSENPRLEGEFFHNGLMSIIADEKSVVEIIRVQSLPYNAVNFDTTKIFARSKTDIKLYDLHLGSSKTGSSTSTYMPEEWSHVEIYPLYFADKERRLDLEQNFIVNGKNSYGLILAKGALKNTAKKIFRGNIFLNKGCSRSIARFSDTTMMLSKTTNGATIPTIFCDEDDVMGEHAATFEALDMEKLFYIMTRGFDEVSAKKLIVDSAFRPIFEMIDHEGLREKLIQEFEFSLDEVI